MNHHTTTDFWDGYNKLPKEVRKLADENYALLRRGKGDIHVFYRRI